MTLTEFLEARIDEDEARASSGWSRLGDSRWETNNYGQDFLTPSAVLAECAAKRAIVKAHPIDVWSGVRGEEVTECRTCQGDPCDTLQALAAIYNKHPEYDGEWAL